MEILKGRELILASKSPRRKELLEKAEIPFSILIKEVEEIYPDDLAIDKVPEYLAQLKASPFLSDLKDNQILLTSDTIVVYDESVMGKPKDRSQAIDFVSKLAGSTHRVITGVCLSSNKKQKLFKDIADVELYPMTSEEVEWYVDKYEPYDKAGAYGIQDWIGYVKIKKITGTYATIMGLPIAKVYQELSRF